MSNVCVAVRVRPLTKSEEDQKAKIIVDVNANTINVTNLKVQANQDYDNRLRVRQYAFDFCYLSLDSNSSNYASQELIYFDLGSKVLDAAFEGFNTCLLAYGQSGSGKTYTMMGSNCEPGLTPRICQGLFEKQDEADKKCAFRTEISFLEIYNERVRDLLASSPMEHKSYNALRVREHPKLGPCVQELSKHVAGSYEEVQALIDRGVLKRSMAATKMHSNSSRSHAIFTITFSQAKIGEISSDMTSKIHLVDLAGSERSSVHTSKVRMKEGSNINKSLVALGSVICALGSPQRSQPPFVPYRDSVLTWLLKDSLGGNSKTIMVATISPSNTAYNETLSTLRYANQAKSIVNRPIINEDPNVTLVRELKAEISRLRDLLSNFEKNKLFVEPINRTVMKEAGINCNLNNDINAYNGVRNYPTLLRSRRSSIEEDMKLFDRRKRKSLDAVANFEKILEMQFHLPNSDHYAPPDGNFRYDSRSYTPTEYPTRSKSLTTGTENGKLSRIMHVWPIFVSAAASSPVNNGIRHPALTELHQAETDPTSDEQQAKATEESSTSSTKQNDLQMCRRRTNNTTPHPRPSFVVTRKSSIPKKLKHGFRSKTPVSSHHKTRDNRRVVEHAVTGLARQERLAKRRRSTSGVSIQWSVQVQQHLPTTTTTILDHRQSSAINLVAYDTSANRQKLLEALRVCDRNDGSMVALIRGCPMHSHGGAQLVVTSEHCCNNSTRQLLQNTSRNRSSQTTSTNVPVCDRLINARTHCPLNRASDLPRARTIDSNECECWSESQDIRSPNYQSTWNKFDKTIGCSTRAISVPISKRSICVQTPFSLNEPCVISPITTDPGNTKSPHDLLTSNEFETISSQTESTDVPLSKRSNSVQTQCLSNESRDTSTQTIKSNVETIKPHDISSCINQKTWNICETVPNQTALIAGPLTNRSISVQTPRSLNKSCDTGAKTLESNDGTIKLQNIPSTINNQLTRNEFGETIPLQTTVDSINGSNYSTGTQPDHQRADSSNIASLQNRVDQIWEKLCSVDHQNNSQLHLGAGSSVYCDASSQTQHSTNISDEGKSTANRNRGITKLNVELTFGNDEELCSASTSPLHPLSGRIAIPPISITSTPIIERHRETATEKRTVNCSEHNFWRTDSIRTPVEMSALNNTIQWRTVDQNANSETQHSTICSTQNLCYCQDRTLPVKEISTPNQRTAVYPMIINHNAMRTNSKKGNDFRDERKQSVEDDNENTFNQSGTDFSGFSYVSAIEPNLSSAELNATPVNESSQNLRYIRRQNTEINFGNTFNSRATNSPEFGYFSAASNSTPLSYLTRIYRNDQNLRNVWKPNVESMSKNSHNWSATDSPTFGSIDADLTNSTSAMTPVSYQTRTNHNDQNLRNVWKPNVESISKNVHNWSATDSLAHGSTDADLTNSTSTMTHQSLTNLNLQTSGQQNSKNGGFENNNCRATDICTFDKTSEVASDLTAETNSHTPIGSSPAPLPDPSLLSEHHQSSVNNKRCLTRFKYSTRRTRVKFSHRNQNCRTNGKLQRVDCKQTPTAPDSSSTNHKTSPTHSCKASVMTPTIRNFDGMSNDFFQLPSTLNAEVSFAIKDASESPTKSKLNEKREASNRLQQPRLNYCHQYSSRIENSSGLVLVTVEDFDETLNEYLKLPWSLNDNGGSFTAQLKSELSTTSNNSETRFGHSRFVRNHYGGGVYGMAMDCQRSSTGGVPVGLIIGTQTEEWSSHLDVGDSTDDVCTRKASAENSYKWNTEQISPRGVLDSDDDKVNCNYEVLTLLAECRKARESAWQQIVGLHQAEMHQPEEDVIGKNKWAPYSCESLNQHNYYK